MKYLLPFSFVCFLLSSFSYRAAALAFISIGLVFLRCSINRDINYKINIRSAFFLLFIFIFTYLISLRFDVYYLYLIKMLAMIVYLWLVNILLSSKIVSKRDLLHYIKVALWINIIVFITQFGVFEVTGYFIDFNNYVREQFANTLRSSRALQFFIIGIRTSGFYSEPSFYAMSVFPASVMIALYEKKIGKTFIFCTLTSLLSLSIAAIAIVLLTLLVYIKEFRNSKIAMLLLLSLVIISIPYLYDFIIDRLFTHSDYDAVGSREVIFQEFHVRSPYNDIFGSGYFHNENKPIGELGLNGAKIRDSSFYVYTYFSSGVLGILFLFFSILFLLPKKLNVKYAFSVLLLFKFGILTSALWFFIMTIIIIQYNEKKGETNE